jgi:hypothetical protein
MAAESLKPTKNPKTQTIRKMLDQEGSRIILTREYQVTKMPTRQRKKRWTRTFQPLKDDLKKWLTEEDQRWKYENNEMKERNLDVDRKEDTKGMPRKDQVVELRTGYSGATHDPKIERVDNLLCSFCNTDIFNGLQHC